MAQEMSMEQIRSRLAGLDLWAIFMRPTEKYNTESEEGRELMRRHLLFQLEMEDKGILLGAGPLEGAGRASTLAAFRETVPDDDQRLVDASGMYIIAASSREAAEEIARSEPFETAGWRTHTLCSWQLNEGTAVPVARTMIEELPAKAD